MKFTQIAKDPPRFRLVTEDPGVYEIFEDGGEIVCEEFPLSPKKKAKEDEQTSDDPPPVKKSPGLFDALKPKKGGK